MQRHVQCGERQAWSSNFTKFCACHKQTMSCFCPFKHQAIFTLAERLRLPRRLPFIINRRHKWNEKLTNFSCQPPSNTRPAAKNWWGKISKTFSEHRWNIFHNARRAQDGLLLSMGREIIIPQPDSRPRYLFALTTTLLFSKQHFALRIFIQVRRVLRLLEKLTLQAQPVQRLPKKNPAFGRKNKTSKTDKTHSEKRKQKDKNFSSILRTRYL